MRRLALSLATLALIMPGTAMACHHGQASSVSVSCEKGVKVYRGAPLVAPTVQGLLPSQLVNNNLIEQRLALQNERLAAQSERIKTLQNQLEAAEKPRRRGRYGRVYSAPVGTFLKAPRIGHRGYRGHRRSSAIRVSYNRRRF